MEDYAHRNKKGFTLIELSLSLAFISILALAIALIISNAVASYRRGLTLNQINTVGMDIVDDMRAAIQGSSTREPKVEDCSGIIGKACDSSDNLVSVVKKGDIDGVGKVPVAGVFCTGEYSYVWNSGYAFLGDSDKIALRVYKSNDGDEVPISEDEEDWIPRLTKIADNSRSACAWFSLEKNQTKFRVVSTEKPIELISSQEGGNNLAIYDLSAKMSVAGVPMNSLFYSVSFILGTVQGGINVNAAGNFCSPPNDFNSNFDYCAINKFNFAVQATGGRE